MPLLYSAQFALNGSQEIMQQIGELFLLRININLVGSVLDYPVSSPPCGFDAETLTMP